MSEYERMLGELFSSIKEIAVAQVAAEAKRLRDSAKWTEQEWAEYEDEKYPYKHEMRENLQRLWTLLFAESDEVRADQQDVVRRFEELKNQPEPAARFVTIEELAPHGAQPKSFDFEYRRRAVEARHLEIERFASNA